MFEIILIALLVGAFFTSVWYDTLTVGFVGAGVFLAVLFASGGSLPTLPDPLMLVAGIILFLAVGAAWALFMWRQHVNSEYVQDALREGLKKFTTHGDLYDGQRFVESRLFPSAARASRNKERIMTWWLYWPFSMVVYVFDDLLRDLFNWMYARISGVFNSITLSALSDDMKK